MTEVTVGQDQAQEQVQTERGLYASVVENMIMLPRTFQTWKVANKDERDKMQQLMDTEEQDRTLKLFTGETCNGLVKADSEEMIQQLNQ